MYIFYQIYVHFKHLYLKIFRDISAPEIMIYPLRSFKGFFMQIFITIGVSNYNKRKPLCYSLSNLTVDQIT